jgi:release factor glutamine methyltransferase
MGPKSWTIKKLLKVTADYLKKKEIDSPRLSAEILLAHQLKTTRVELYLHFDQPLNDDEIAGYRSLIRRRLGREPIQYITGSQEFWSMDFIVGPQVLIPRPESEILVEQVVSLYKEKRMPGNRSPRILDLGTGCGPLAISLARELEEASLWASDISEEALDFARLNAKRHGVENRVEFMLGDLWQPFVNLGLTFDAILSNPPYIVPEVLVSLSPEVRDHEPRLALDGRDEGMYYIEKIIKDGAGYLNPDGWILLEMDPEQTPKALGLIEESGRYGGKKRVKDYGHHYRAVMAQKASK